MLYIYTLTVSRYIFCYSSFSSLSLRISVSSKIKPITKRNTSERVMKRSTSKRPEKKSNPAPKRCNKERSKEINIFKDIEKEKTSLIMNTGNKTQNLPKPVPIKQDYRKCPECLKWEMRLQEQMKIVQLLTEETMNLHKDKKALEREKNTWETHKEALE